MSVIRSKRPNIGPELRLARAISEFEADLPDEQKREYHKLKSQTFDSPPNLNDVNRLAAEINLQISVKAGGRCYGPRFTNFLHGVQQFASIGDVMIGGTQNLLACGIWSLVRMSLLVSPLMASNFVYSHIHRQSQASRPMLKRFRVFLWTLDTQSHAAKPWHHYILDVLNYDRFLLSISFW
jgi:hypothetical protein